ncbi:MAG: oligosaccharide flippase family protein [Myxococcales bacterium]
MEKAAVRFSPSAGWISDSARLTLATLASSLLSAAYVGICGRALGPSEYSIVAALLALSAITTLLNPAADGIAKLVADHMGRDDVGTTAALWRLAWRWALGLAAGVTVLGCVASPWIATWLDIPSHGPVLAFVAYLASTIAIGAPRALQRGLHRFEAFALNQVAEAGVRLVLGASLALLGFGALGVLAGYALGTGAAALLGRLSLGDVTQAHVSMSGSRTDAPAPTAPSQRGGFGLSVSLPFMFMSICSLGLMNADVIAAKHVLTDEQAGLYGAASSLSRLAAVAAAPLTVVLLSKVTTAKAAGRPIGKLVLGVVGTLLGLLLVGLLGTVLVGEWAVVLMYGQAFRGSAPLLTLLVASVCLLVLQSSVCTVLIGINRHRGFWLLLVPPLVQITLLQVNHGDARAIALDTLWAAGSGLLVLAAILGLNRADERSDA